MELLAIQKHLLRVLSLGGLIPFPGLLLAVNRRGKCVAFYVAYASTIHLILLFVAVIQYHYPPSILLGKVMASVMDKTSGFVLFTSYLQWKIILPTIAIHSALNIDKLSTFFNIIKRTGCGINQPSSNQPIAVRAMLCALVIALRITDMLLYQTNSWKMMCLRFADFLQGLMFDFYQFHLYCQVWIIQSSFRHVKQKLNIVLMAGSYEQIVRTLRECNLLFKALQAFNDYYGLIMAEMCIVLFLRCSLTLYFVLILSDDTWFSFDVSYTLIYAATWNTGIIIYIFHMMHNTSMEVNETTQCMRHFADCDDIANSRTYRQLNQFLLNSLHQKKSFSAYGFFDINNSVIYMIFSSVITYLVILVQFKQLEIGGF